ncbi:WhiB family transcriptional regulator [Actinoallomurus sp. CA-150999]|uniref:WhiB family transcriptional regulator n=1 Tax=Actinoallomurus sp. CA-150999 TaxID=3239887 RepID=UPI003D931DDB
MTRQTYPRSVDRGIGDDVTALPASVLRHRVALGDCSGLATNEWFPPEPDVKYPEARTKYEAVARQLCGGCPVIAECLELALRAESRPFVIPHGVFGGRAPWERQALIRARRRRAHAARLRDQAEEVSA